MLPLVPLLPRRRHNAAAALVTRGFAEMARLGLAMGANLETLTGLSGLGDLVLTCHGPLSRNRALGAALGKGTSLRLGIRPNASSSLPNPRRSTYERQ